MSGASPQARPQAILFVCTENAIRSPMAATLYQALYPNASYVQSAGIRAGETNLYMPEVMKELGADLEGHKPHTLNDLQDSLFDIIITLSPEAHHQAMELTRTMAVDVDYWPTMDPTLVDGNRDQRLDAFRACRDTLKNKILEQFGEPIENERLNT